MSFTTLTFATFFLVVLVIYWQLRNTQAKNIFLLITSYVFYGWLHPWYAILLGVSTIADHQLAWGIYKKEKQARTLFFLSLFLNLGVLSFFKYFNFFREDLIATLQNIGIEPGYYFINLVLPFGLSFFTLKKLGYMIDVFNKRLVPTKSLINFGLFVAFFPQLAAGPIDKAQKLIPQIEAKREWKTEYFSSSWQLILMGIFKKVVIASSIGSFISRLFAMNSLSGTIAIAAALGFTLQILADFSAYTDLSRGVARLLGFETSENFNNPYFSLTPSDFWDRWHITLSHWLRDYIFFPIRRFLMRRKERYPNWIIQSAPPLITMLVSGVWHGAGWTYVIWGAYYGLLIVIYQALGIHKNNLAKSSVKSFFVWLIMFSWIVFGWLIFSAPSIGWVIDLFSHPFIGSQAQIIIATITFTMTIFYTAPLLIKMALDKYFHHNSFLHTLYYVVITLMTIIYINSATPDFIYFQF